MTTIKEARDLNTLSLEDLISSLKFHELGLNQDEPAKKSKSIALKGKSSKALKADESEDESPAGGSDEDPEAEEMTMLSKRLQYLAKRNKSFSNNISGYKESISKKEDQKGCFNCKKLGHFIADCPELQKDKSKEKLKKTSFKSSNFRNKIKKSMMSTWDDLDKESESEKEEFEEQANLALVADDTRSYITFVIVFM